MEKKNIVKHVVTVAGVSMAAVSVSAVAATVDAHADSTVKNTNEKVATADKVAQQVVTEHHETDDKAVADQAKKDGYDVKTSATETTDVVKSDVVTTDKVPADAKNVTEVGSKTVKDDDKVVTDVTSDEIPADAQNVTKTGEKTVTDPNKKPDVAVTADQLEDAVKNGAENITAIPGATVTVQDPNKSIDAPITKDQIADAEANGAENIKAIPGATITVKDPDVASGVEITKDQIADAEANDGAINVHEIDGKTVTVKDPDVASGVEITKDQIADAEANDGAINVHEIDGKTVTVKDPDVASGVEITKDQIADAEVKDGAINVHEIDGKTVTVKDPDTIVTGVAEKDLPAGADSFVDGDKTVTIKVPVTVTGVADNADNRQIAKNLGATVIKNVNGTNHTTTDKSVADAATKAGYTVTSSTTPSKLVKDTKDIPADAKNVQIVYALDTNKSTLTLKADSKGVDLSKMTYTDPKTGTVYQLIKSENGKSELDSVQDNVNNGTGTLNTWYQFTNSGKTNGGILGWAVGQFKFSQITTGDDHISSDELKADADKGVLVYRTKISDYPAMKGVSSSVKYLYMTVTPTGKTDDKGATIYTWNKFYFDDTPIYYAAQGYTYDATQYSWTDNNISYTYEGTQNVQSYGYKIHNSHQEQVYTYDRAASHQEQLYTYDLAASHQEQLYTYDRAASHEEQLYSYELPASHQEQLYRYELPASHQEDIFQYSLPQSHEEKLYQFSTEAVGQKLHYSWEKTIVTLTPLKVTPTKQTKKTPVKHVAAKTPKVVQVATTTPQKQATIHLATGATTTAKRLPQTGDSAENTVLSVIGLAMLGLLGLFGIKRRKQN
ncbi:LPXTG cell wall anchor domain-containing protein [Periweissella cryptocerci]|uniref:LPXTG cell wall anchor domain-containing protein n=1 Tax=Periweissella cryptocerci TaxID=2506420 RepID=A0A4P6YRE4_9LACO|nr:LPXTG cell wall anchor domain-containing protein [Periweissella cryptocerci]QBO35194.1 LPXTG cell wall anchor domain-containing protein [Periweissella cryptocerci]